jgi:hypothetical protein
MSATPNRLSHVPKSNEASAPDKPRQRPMARLLEMLGRKPKALSVNLRRVGEK